MLNTLLRWLLYSLAIIFIAWLIPGITVANFFSAMFVCLIMALLNAIIKPLLVFISMPINFLTLGLFMFVINALLFMLAGAIAPGFAVNGFFSALLGSVLLSIFAMGIEKI
jgi:putative membrane protein